MKTRIALVSISVWALACSEAATPKDGGGGGPDSTVDGTTPQDSGPADTGIVVDASLCGHLVLDPKKSALVVNEMLAKGAEFVEIYNTGSNAIDLTGVSISDTDSDGGCPKTSEAITLPNGTSIGGGSYIVVYTGQAEAGACDASGCYNATYKISNGSGETIFVLSPSGDITTSGTYPPNAATAGKSWSRLPNGTGDFANGTPSPGAANMP